MSLRIGLQLLEQINPSADAGDAVESAVFFDRNSNAGHYCSSYMTAEMEEKIGLCEETNVQNRLEKKRK